MPPPPSSKNEPIVPPAPFLLWSALTHVGRLRKNNEDAFLALTVDEREVHYLGKTGQITLATTNLVFAISDGVGGARAGEFASRIAVDRITQLCPRAFQFAGSGLGLGFTNLLNELATLIHQDLTKLSSSYEECAGMGATLSLCWITPERLYFLHVGDSRIYHLPKDGPLRQITHDHSHVGWLRRQAKINEREARSHPRRHALQQALGSGNQFIDPQIDAVTHRPGDRFLVCSDGLVDGLWDRQIEEILRAPANTEASPSLAQRLVDAAVLQSGRDNTTAITIEILPSAPNFPT